MPSPLGIWRLCCGKLEPRSWKLSMWFLYRSGFVGGDGTGELSLMLSLRLSNDFGGGGGGPPEFRT